MKILNFFKTKSKTLKSAKQVIDKNQLNKIVGGTETLFTSGTTTAAHEAAHVIQQSK